MAELVPRPRIIIFCPSIVAELGDPQVTLARQTGRALAESGADVRFWEERRNPAYLAALKQFGASGVSTFAQEYPELTHLTYELPSLREVTTWLAFQIALFDAVIALQGTPELVVNALRLIEPGPELRLFQTDEEQKLISLGEQVQLPFGPDHAGEILRAIDTHAEGFRRAKRTANHNQNSTV